MNYENSYSLSDIAAATGNNGRNSDGMFGDGNGAWFIILFLIFAVFGWGRNGNGFGGGTGSVSDNYVLASDFATLQRQIDSSTATLERKSDTIQQGLCDGFYAMNTGMLNGFSGVQQAMCQGFSGINQAIATNGYETRLGTQALGSQLASCCCNIEKAVQGVNYNMATNTCALQNTMNNNTRDIIDSQNAGTRAILDFLTQDKIATLTAENNDLRRAASQDRQNALLTSAMSAQTNQIINAVNPAPIPAYTVPNPNAYYGCGCNTGCNC